MSQNVMNDANENRREILLVSARLASCDLPDFLIAASNRTLRKRLSEGGAAGENLIVRLIARVACMKVTRISNGLRLGFSLQVSLIERIE